jgi:hypothetical protein
LKIQNEIGIILKIKLLDFKTFESKLILKFNSKFKSRGF